MQELDEILKQDETAKAEEEAQKKASEAKAEEEKKQDDEVQKKRTELENLEKAKQEALAELKRIRDAKKGENKEEEEIPKIDFTDPSSKAWDRHIKQNVNPLQEELEKEKEEIRTYALKEFLADKPALASNPDKIKELMETYEKIKTASERTKEGVLIDLNKSFGAVFHDELISQAREVRVNRAKSDILFSDPAVSRGSTAYFKEHESSPVQSLTDDDKAILAKWGMSPDEWAKTKTEMDKKYE